MFDTQVLILSSLLVFFLNLPFGYWRANTRKFGRQWYLAVHLPVPFVILIRYLMHTGWHWSSYVFLVGAFFLGQLAGGSIHKIYRSRYPENTGSCLFMDLYRCCRKHQARF